MRQDEIATPRLLLRRARPSDLDALHAILGDPRAMRYWSTLAHAELGQTRAFLDAMIAASPVTSDDYVVTLQGRVIGKAGFWKIPEIGFVFHPDHWGQGLAREALDAVIAHLFETTVVPAVEADVDPRNEASLRLLHRLGFNEIRRAERTFEIAGAWVDSVYLGLDRPG